jgi:hypothetical protein
MGDGKPFELLSTKDAIKVEAIVRTFASSLWDKLLLFKVGLRCSSQEINFNMKSVSLRVNRFPDCLNAMIWDGGEGSRDGVSGIVMWAWGLAWGLDRGGGWAVILLMVALPEGILWPAIFGWSCKDGRLRAFRVTGATLDEPSECVGTSEDTKDPFTVPED